MLSIILAMFPSFLHVSIRRLLGAKIGKGVRIRFGTIIKARQIEIGEESRIGPFSLVYCRDLSIGKKCTIKSFSIMKCNHVNIDNYVHIAPFAFIVAPLIKGANISIGDHSRVFPFCWIEPGEGVTIGRHVGIGGHTLIFTHGVWANYLRGGPVAFGPVTIGDHVWLPWRVFILPNVAIGDNVIVGGNSFLTKNVPSNSLVAGSPAKILKEGYYSEVTNELMLERMSEIIEKFGAYQERCYKDADHKITLVCDDNLEKGDLLVSCSANINSEKIGALKLKGVSTLLVDRLEIFYGKKEQYITDFIGFLRCYGVRISD